ncbi:MAG: CPBP family intramembrane glutamic endopeptidase [Bacteroidota bacterium]
MPESRSAYLLRSPILMLYLFPPVLIVGNYLSFQFFSNLSGNRNGYLAGMIFYWLFWCLLPFFLLVSKGNRKLLLKIKRINWWQIVLLSIPVLLAFLFGPFRSRIGDASPLIIALSLIYATVNAFSEELLWRGMYFDHHQGNFFYAAVVPSIWFGIWHYAPLSVQSSLSGNFYFMISAIGLGFCWSIITYYTRSVFWSIISHILVDFFGIGALYFFK